ncbi:MAG: CopG family ribbon-helix-helix protein [Bosea sp. (in: a-proteobacteria)]
MSVSFSIRMDEALRARLEKEAQAEDRSASYLAQKAISAFLDARASRRQEMLAAFAQSQTETEFVSGDAVSAWVESWETATELPVPAADISRPFKP